ncbi:MAG: hypothetical protein GX575_17840 [Candidatus Anammoximicrobium sp.]|nr:hypothetical protein [Candidatus Anammoximicrobium sp.]
MRSTLLWVILLIGASLAWAGRAESAEDATGGTRDGTRAGQQKPLAFLTATAVDGKVRLTCFKSTPFFEATRQHAPDSVKLRIWRRDLPEFRFGRDYGEYFDGLSRHDARVVFEGTISAVNNRKYEFLDESVRCGQTYAYWVGVDGDGLPTGPVAVKVRDPRVWWSGEETQRRLETLAAQFSGVVESREVGQTVHGRRLRALLAGRRDRMLVLIGSLHAGESGPELIVPAFETVVRDHPDLLKRAGLAILPRVNSDERERMVRGYPPYVRTNSNGVDLNRNFAADWETIDSSYGLITTDPDGMTYRGPSPASEPETLAVVRLFQGLKPAAVLSYHHLASITGSAFLYPKLAAKDSAYAARCTELNRVYRAAISPPDIETTPTVARAGTTGGSLPAWVYAQFGVPAMDVEGDRSPWCVKATLDTATWEDVQEAQQRHTRAVVAVLSALAAAP